MLQVTVDGETYEYDQAKLMNTEAKVIQRHTGLTMQEWNDQLVKGDVDAVDALVWLVKSRTGDPTPIDSVVYDLGSLNIVNPDRVDEPDPTMTTSPESSQDELAVEVVATI